MPYTFIPVIFCYDIFFSLSLTQISRPLSSATALPLPCHPWLFDQSQRLEVPGRMTKSMFRRVLIKISALRRQEAHSLCLLFQSVLSSLFPTAMVFNQPPLPLPSAVTFSPSLHICGCYLTRLICQVHPFPKVSVCLPQPPEPPVCFAVASRTEEITCVCFEFAEIKLN